MPVLWLTSTVLRLVGTYFDRSEVSGDWLRLCWGLWELWLRPCWGLWGLTSTGEISLVAPKHSCQTWWPPEHKNFLGDPAVDCAVGVLQFSPCKASDARQAVWDNPGRRVEGRGSPTRPWRWREQAKLIQFSFWKSDFESLTVASEFSEWMGRGNERDRVDQSTAKKSHWMSGPLYSKRKWLNRPVYRKKKDSMSGPHLAHRRPSIYSNKKNTCSIFAGEERVENQISTPSASHTVTHHCNSAQGFVLEQGAMSADAEPAKIGGDALDFMFWVLFDTAPGIRWALRHFYARWMTYKGWIGLRTMSSMIPCTSQWEWGLCKDFSLVLVFKLNAILWRQMWGRLKTEFRNIDVWGPGSHLFRVFYAVYIPIPFEGMGGSR